MNSVSHSHSAGERLRSVRTLAGAVTLTLLSWLAVPLAARADNIDAGFFKQKEVIVKELRSHGYKNVGVLKFQVQKGNAAPSLRVGRLNTMLATRLENALILANDDANPIGITRGASEVAAYQSKGKASYLTPAGREQLFQHTYPLAWGETKPRVDAFLTGLVQINPDMKRVKVVIQAFDKQNSTPREVTHFSVNVDRTLLADMDQTFVIAKRALRKRAVSDEELVEEAVAPVTGVVTEPNTKQPDGPPIAPIGEVPVNLASDFDKVLEFKVYYDGQLVPRSADNKLQSPNPGQRVHFTVRSSERIGLVLRVNGVNTLKYEREPKEIDYYAKWILEPNKDYTIRGFYPTTETLREFIVLTPTEVDMSEMGDENKLGSIDLDVYRESSASVTSTANLETPAVAERKISLRGVTGRAATLAELRGKVRSTLSRNVIVGGKEKGGEKIATVPFSGQHAAHLGITYFARGGSGGPDIITPVTP